MLRRFVVIAATLSSGAVGYAEPTTPIGPEAPPIPTDRPVPEATTFVEAADLNAPFGPARLVEEVAITGDGATGREEIIAVLPFGVGDTLAAGDSVLRDARLRVLSLGTYRDVDVRISKGSQHGAIIVHIAVLPRPTWSLNRLWIGRSHSSDLWFGGEVEKKNLWRRIDVAGSALVALPSDIAGDATQTAFALRASQSPYLSMPFGGQLTLRHGNYREPVRLTGEPNDRDDGHFIALAYQYTEATINGLWDVTKPARLRAGPRLGVLHADQVPALMREQAGVMRPIDVGLMPGNTMRMSANVGIEFDWRDHPLNPRQGSYADLDADVLVRGLGSEYAAVKLSAQLEHWISFQQRRGALGLLAQARLVLGDPPRTDRIYINDIYDWLPARSLGMSLATRAPRDIFGTGVDQTPSGNQAAAASLRYVHRVIKKGRWIERGDLFISSGVFVLRDTKEYNGSDAVSFPIGLVVDLGMRLETRYGIVELSLANLGSRLP